MVMGEQDVAEDGRVQQAGHHKNTWEDAEAGRGEDTGDAN